ncbi:hypothetical protein [Rhizobium leguminosarum]|uniref:hypothetical protein n=1 Tax=Rhizobium leguminosarum TaxID=384 RepID=UPI0021B0F059|nr:hypothetical protein [Rhizobium leguminosarum]
MIIILGWVIGINYQPVASWRVNLTSPLLTLILRQGLQHGHVRITYEGDAAVSADNERLWKMERQAG